MPGKVFLIGASPASDLITVRGASALREADVVVYDNLADEALFEGLDAETIDAGKSAGDHTLTQDEIEKILVEKAREGNVVARLKGGDPFVFGRGGEEMLRLREESIEYEVVPGVTSAVSVPAKYGVPVTHRGISTSFCVVTGHEDPTKPEKQVEWRSIANVGTIVVLMGVGNLPEIVEKVTDVRGPGTPIAAFERGYREGERVVWGTLGDVVDVAEREDLRPPAVIVIGEVVRLGSFWEE
ncbi:MAG: Uroporphyrinogen-III C-methyltransferase [Methanonatronarchaeales archaeon]|nr:Uroporphyrinogen-III C-methyltransferase [Methanonatronarchaeales archaeon]